MTEGANIGEAKAQARAHLLKMRAQATPNARAAAATRAWAALSRLRGAVIAGYLPIGSEVDPTQTMRSLAASNTICVPVVTGKGAPLRFREWWPGCKTEPGPFKVPVPTEGGWRVPNVLIVPMVGFDAGCARLGYGGGFYDRTLAGLPDAQTLGLAVEAQKLVQIPREATDVRLNAIVTEAGVYQRRATG